MQGIEKQAILIVGMHRSGTSALARTIALHGCDLPRTLGPASKNNQRGFWESIDIIHLNDEILRLAGSDWDDWRPFSPSWYDKKKCRDLHDRALDVLADQFGDSGLFVLKDPRMVRLLPFWLEALREFDADPRIICPIRNPLDVAASLSRRDSLDPLVGRLLWLRHVLDGEFASRELKRCFVRYEDLLHAWPSVISRIAKELDIVFPVSSEIASPDVEAFLTPQLQHHKHDNTALGDGSIEESVRRTFEIVNGWADGETVTHSDITALDSIRSAFDDSAEFYYPVIRSALRVKTAEIQRNRTVLDQLTATRRKLGSIENSTSWRITRPLRVVSNSLSSLGGRFRSAAEFLLAGHFENIGRAISPPDRTSHMKWGRNPTYPIKPQKSKILKISQYETKTALFDLSQEVIEENHRLVSRARQDPFFAMKEILWFLPSFNQIFRGGIYTIFRFAAHFQEREGAVNTFVVFDEREKFNFSWALKALNEEFPNLKFRLLVISKAKDVEGLPPSDVAFCTFWKTAYLLAQYNKCSAKFYFVQDFEPAFCAAGSEYAMIEQTYQLGFFGVANTPGVGELYRQYNPWVVSFVPGVDKSIFRPNMSAAKDVCRVVFYGRPSNSRNAFELGISSLKIIKKWMGDKVDIVSAGAKYSVEDYGLYGVLENRGLLSSIDEVAELYRSSDVGLVFMYTAHPSYQPFEFMASGCVPVSNFNRFTNWFLRDGENCILAPSTPTAIAQAVCSLVEDPERRRALAREGLETVRALDWDKPLEQIREFVRRPMPAAEQELVPDFDAVDFQARRGRNFRKIGSRDEPQGRQVP